MKTFSISMLFVFFMTATSVWAYQITSDSDIKVGEITADVTQFPSLFDLSTVVTRAEVYPLSSDSDSSYHAWELQCDDGSIETVYYSAEYGGYSIPGQGFRTLDEAATSACGESRFSSDVKFIKFR